MDEKQITELPTELEDVRDAAIAHAHGECSAPKKLEDLFEWLYWNTNETEFDCPYVRFDALELTDIEAREELEIAEGEPVSDLQRLEYARRRMEREWSSEGVHFAHAYRIQRADGKYTYLCGTSVSAGQGGPETSCDGTFPSEEAYLRWLDDCGVSNEDAQAISIETVLKHWLS